jgi:hypothetical protein
MRQLRILKQDVWYNIRTAINNREPLFQRWQALALFGGVLGEAQNRFVFEMKGLHLAGDLLTFYLKPANGLELPDILKWIKQTFAVRYNLFAGRTGHIWGDRYWSLILDGEPPEEAKAEPSARAGRGGVRPQPVKMVIIAGFSPILPSSLPQPPP